MNRDEIVRMARSAGLPFIGFNNLQKIERFAALVAAAEREACAKVCDAEVEYAEANSWGSGDDISTAKHLAKKIRARGA